MADPVPGLMERAKRERAGETFLCELCRAPLLRVVAGGIAKFCAQCVERDEPTGAVCVTPGCGRIVGKLCDDDAAQYPGECIRCIDEQQAIEDGDGEYQRGGFAKDGYRRSVARQRESERK